VEFQLVPLDPIIKMAANMARIIIVIAIREVLFIKIIY